ncbi:MAG: helix-turn-helix domain-containing protein [Abitibacteriaceae bacterium]|nr:helix-turn-helix domain-containing protein [Abditibacteriaceae bacterium]MBV9865232.1 helix-turn-helix domain-containing protein [Abditibacteriaceae bacterium]
MDDNLLTVRDAARLKDISRTAVYAAIAQGRLPHVTVLGKIGLLKSDVIAWTPQGHRSGRPAGRPMSAEAKARISEAQKLRWAKRKLEKKG